MAVTYDEAFFERIRQGVVASADAAVPVILGWLADADFYPRSVVDVGCGEGWWARRFWDEGSVGSVLGVDGEGGGAALAHVDPAVAYRQVDLEGRWSSSLPRFDLAVCLEVAEHLELEAAGRLVEALTKVAPVVVFSAAVPGQPGHGHVSCAWQSEWAALFEAAGYRTSDELRWEIWEDREVEWWYAQNIFVAWKPGSITAVPRPVHSVIHPRFWDVR